MRVQAISKIASPVRKQVQLLLPFMKKKPKQVQMTFRFPKISDKKKLNKLV